MLESGWSKRAPGTKRAFLVIVSVKRDREVRTTTNTNSSEAIERNDRLCENSEASKTVEKRNHISPKIDDLIPKSVSFMLQSGTT
jgi:hypothetical protein